MLAVVPALVAAITIWGLVAEPGQIVEQITAWTSALPADASSVIVEQAERATSEDSEALSIGLVVSLAAVLYSASGGMNGLIKGVNAAYDEQETRGFLKLRGLALGLTVGALAFVLVALGLVAALPAALGNLGLGDAARVGLNVARWPLLAVIVAAALAVIYRFAPDRDAPRFAWVSPGALVATVLWLIGSALFSLYVSQFGNYANTYGALAGVVVLLLWLFLTAAIVLLGAEINAEAEHQTVRDTTTGRPEPIGQRDARAADTVGESAE